MQVCTRCVLPETYPGITFDENGVCNICHTFDAGEKEREPERFQSEEEVKAALQKYKNLGRKYDLLVPLSGGVDSCFTLIRIVEDFGLKPMVFHSDHGWDDPIATRNVEKLCKELDVDLLIWKNELKFMRRLFKIFNESTEPDVSPCFPCGNMLYLNGLEIAANFNVPLVINGYSKGQTAMMHDEKKARDWYSKMINVILDSGDTDFLDQFTKKWAVLNQQVIYQDRRDLEKPVDPEKILFIPFFVFKFYKTDKEELKKICKARFDWEPLEEGSGFPARTTNCEMIWLNSVRDMKIRKYTHYHDEYSTIVRAGEMTREQALEDLELDPPPGLLEKLAKDINFDLKYLDTVKPKKVEPRTKFVKAESKMSKEEDDDFSF
ncbi:MAG: hypothetical protein KAW12_14300 [Candidatus Aminicenantes bacterium]|nr:hypothetical protein [Candidatus Aminicenantes bacterium]